MEEKKNTQRSEKKTAQFKATRTHNIHIKKRKMIEALEKSFGVVTVAAKAAGIDRGAHYDWYRDDEAYRASVDAISDVALDFVETKLFHNINTGDVASTLFYLKTKGKKRGYIERSEHEVNANIQGSVAIDEWIKDRIKK
jgi:hypothetical protein